MSFELKAFVLNSKLKTQNLKLSTNFHVIEGDFIRFGGIKTDVAVRDVRRVRDALDELPVDVEGELRPLRANLQLVGSRAGAKHGCVFPLHNICWGSVVKPDYLIFGCRVRIDNEAI